MSPWEQKAEILGVNYQTWTPPNYGQADRAHFNYQAFETDERALEAEVAALREQVGAEPYVPAPKVKQETTNETEPTRDDKLAKASDFLASIDEILPIAS